MNGLMRGLYRGRSRDLVVIKMQMSIEGRNLRGQGCESGGSKNGRKISPGNVDLFG